MKEFTLETELGPPRPRDKVFAFFANARNLETLTPSWLKFEVLTPAPIAMRPGRLIDYRIRVHGLCRRATGRSTAPKIAGNSRQVCLHGYPICTLKTICTYNSLLIT
jgi:ligand-binding SRPBCC domain-containing protein